MCSLALTALLGDAVDDRLSVEAASPVAYHHEVIHTVCWLFFCCPYNLWTLPALSCLCSAVAFIWLLIFSYCQAHILKLKADIKTNTGWLQY